MTLSEQPQVSSQLAQLREKVGPDHLQKFFPTSVTISYIQNKKIHVKVLSSSLLIREKKKKDIYSLLFNIHIWTACKSVLSGTHP